jgi:hypothetical protein
MFSGLVRILSCLLLFGIGSEALGGGDVGIAGDGVPYRVPRPVSVDHGRHFVLTGPSLCELHPSLSLGSLHPCRCAELIE